MIKQAVTLSMTRNHPDFLMVPGHQDIRFAIQTELPRRVVRQILRAVKRYEKWKDYLRGIEEKETGKTWDA